MKIVLLFLMTMALTLFSGVGFASDVIVKKAKVSIEKVENIAVDSVSQLNSIEVIKLNNFVNSSAKTIRCSFVYDLNNVGNINKPLIVNHTNKLTNKKILYSLNEHRITNLNYLKKYNVSNYNLHKIYKIPYLC